MPSWKKVIVSGSDANLNSLTVTNDVTASSALLTQGATLSGSLFISGTIENVKHIKFDTTDSEVLNEGELGWNSNDGTLNLGLNGGDVTLQIGQEIHYRVRNQSGQLIENGSFVYRTGVQDSKFLIDKFVADGTVDHEAILGVATEDIADNSNGYVTYFGYVRNIDTSGFSQGDDLFAHPTIAGSFTNVEPLPPSQSIYVGTVTDVSTSGSIFARTHVHLEADDIYFYNSGSELIATNIGAALRELDASKASVDLLSSNIILYPTTGSSPVSGYFRMVTTPTDPDYNTTAVDVPTGAISGSNQFIAALASDEGIFVGNPGIISVTTIGNIRKVGGSGQAQFYFEIYQRSGSVETLVGTSNNTPPIDAGDYIQFSDSALLNNGTFLSTDRIVIKYYGTKDSGGSDPSYEFQFGGITPVRTLLPVPVSVIPSGNASSILTNTSNFNGKLSGVDDTVQKALDTLDDHTHTLQEITDAGNTTSAQLNLGGLNVDGGVLYVDSTNNRVGVNKTFPSSSLDVNGTISGSGLYIENNSKLNTLNVIAATGSFSGSFSGDGSGLTNIPITAVETSTLVTTSSFNSYTSSVDSRLNSLEVESGSIRTDFNSYTSSVDSRLNSLEVESGSIRTAFNTFTSSYNTGSFTGSFIGLFTGTLTGTATTASYVTFTNVANKPSLVSGSSQIDHDATTNFVANEHIDHSGVSITAGSGLSGGGNITATRTLTLDTGSAHFTGGVKAKLNADGVISSSIQVDHDATTNFVANEHIDHSGVSITAGSGLSGGGNITATRTLTLDTGSAHFTGGVKAKLNADGVVSSSIQVDHDATTNFVANEHIDHSTVSITAGSGLIGGGNITATRTFSVDSGSMLPYYSSSIFSRVSGDITINSSTGVATIAANSVALGTDTTGNYVGTITSGTGIDTTGATTGEGIAHTISVDVSDFMSNGADNRVVTATGTDAMNAEANLTFNGNELSINGSLYVSQSASGTGTNDYLTSFITNNSGGVVSYIQNTSPTGWSGIRFFNDSGIRVGSVGSGNSGTSLLTDMMYLISQNNFPLYVGSSYTSGLDGMYFTSDNYVGLGGIIEPVERFHISGSIRVDKVLLSNQENLDVDSAATEVIATVPTATYDAAFFDFVIKNGSNLRAGTVYAVHDGTNVEFTETSTNDIGTTSGVTLSVDISSGNLRLLATTTTDNWIIKTLVRGL